MKTRFRFITVVTMMALVSTFSRAAFAQERVLAPGNEEVVSRIVGVGADASELGGCEVGQVSIARASVDARYSCSAGNVTLVLSASEPARDLEARFEGPAPESLRDGVTRRLSSMAPQLRWNMVAPPSPEDTQHGHDPSVRARVIRRGVFAAIVATLVTLAAGFFLRRGHRLASS